MPQDAFTLRYIAKELKERLTGGKISKIIQPDRDTLSFIVYTVKGNVCLTCCLAAQGARISLNEPQREAPASAPNFCMLLRKHLQNAQIVDIAQPDFERIIYFDLKCTDEFSQSAMRLYFEIMGKYSNAVLCEDGIIVGALKCAPLNESAKRVLFGGVKYCPPPPQDKIDALYPDKIDSALKNRSGSKAQFISDNIKGVSYSTALEMVSVYGEAIDGKNIYDYVYYDPVSPCVTYVAGEPSDFKVRSTSMQKKQYPDLLSAQCAYYSHITAKKNFNDKKNALFGALSSGLKKVEKRIAQMREKLFECSDAELIKLKGELVCANLHAIKRGDKKLVAVNYYDENCPEISVELDPSLTPSQNMQKYYKRYAKLKRTAESVQAQLDAAEGHCEYLKCIESNINSADTLADLEETEQELFDLHLIKQDSKRKKTTPPPYRSFEYNGFKILVGRNNMQNDRLVKRLAPDDIWLHAQKYHSAHAAIISDGKEVPDEVIRVAAQICAYYSDGRGGAKIPVDYTKKEYVKKPKSAPLGFVVYTDYKTALADPAPHDELKITY